MPARDVFLIRHAESEWNAIGRWQGMANIGLTERGHEQAQMLAATWEVPTVTHLFASTLDRARDTARPLAAKLQLPIVEDADLCELDVGSWQGKTRAEIRAEDPDSLDAFFRGEQGWIGGESYESHALRAERFASRMAQLPDDASAVVVTHGGTLRAILLALLEMDHTQRWRFSGASHVHRSHVQAGDHGYRLLAYNASVGTYNRQMETL